MNFGFRFGLNKRGDFVAPPNQPLIDYTDLAATTSSVDNKRYITDKGKSPNYPLALNSGSGVYFNGVDQKIGNFIIPLTAVSMLYIKNGVNYYTTTLINFSLTVSVGAYKDVYYFNRALAQTEIDNNKNKPEQFFIDAKNDNTCVLNMPMNEDKDGMKAGVVINYQDMSEHTITNKTNDSRDLALNIPYGLQNSKLVRDDNGVIQDASDYYEMDGLQVPAMSLDMIDTQLGSKFVFDFVIEREPTNAYKVLVDSLTSNTGIKLYTSVGLAINRIMLQVGNSISVKLILKDINDSNPHHIIFEVTETTLTMIVDGVAETPVPHSFVPSGLNFKDSTQASPIGTLRHFKVYDEANYDSYDRQEAIDYVIDKGLLL